MQPSQSFHATIEIIGVNPFVFVPEAVLQHVFERAGRCTGKVPVQLTIDGHPFHQTLVRYQGHWRLYLNTPMRRAAGKQVGEAATFTLAFDPTQREAPLPEPLRQALAEHPEAQAVFDGLTPSRRLEIGRYIARLKTESSVARNVQRAIRFLLGQERFIGRAHP